MTASAHFPKRVVSLVPSVTESLFDLGLGDRLVGITDYCVHPAAGVSAVPRVGGTKNVRLTEVLALSPELVIANREENSRADVESIQAAGVPVWVTYPRSVRDALDLLWDMIRRFGAHAQSQRLTALETVVEWARSATGNHEPRRVFCPIWRAADNAWWMTVDGDTYVSDVITVCGGENIFAPRHRRYPLAADLDPTLAPSPADDRDTHYPRVTVDDVRAARPDVILLPSEPFAFSPADAEFWAQFADLPAVQNGRIHLVDGTLLTWHGTRLAKALHDLPNIIMS